MAESLREWLQQNPPPDSAFRRSLAEVSERVVGGEEFFFAVREFLDEASFMSPRLLQRAIDEPPAPTGDARYDAYLGALAEHLSGRHGLNRPEWSIEPHRFLETFWFPSRVEGFRALAIRESPAAFRRRCIFISAGSLVRV